MGAVTAGWRTLPREQGGHFLVGPLVPTGRAFTGGDRVICAFSRSGLTLQGDRCHVGRCQKGLKDSCQRRGPSSSRTRPFCDPRLQVERASRGFSPLPTSVSPKVPAGPPLFSSPSARVHCRSIPVHASVGAPWCQSWPRRARRASADPHPSHHGRRPHSLTSGTPGGGCG